MLIINIYIYYFIDYTILHYYIFKSCKFVMTVERSPLWCPCELGFTLTVFFYDSFLCR
jgi:hypothetical protein